MGEERNNSHDGEDTDGLKIGAILEQARKKRGLSLQEVERATKIRPRYLEGLEREDYSVLPDPVYVRGFLKTYANFLGLNGEELSREFGGRRKPRRERRANYGPPEKSEFERPLISPGGLSGTEDRRRVSGMAILTIVLAVVVLATVIGALYWVGTRAQEEPAAETPPPAEEPAGQPADPEPQPAAEPPPPAPAPEVLETRVSVVDTASWLEVVVDGTVVYQGIAQPGFSQTFEAQEEVTVTAGYPGAVQVEVNGQSVGTLGQDGQPMSDTFTLKDAS